MKELSIEEKAKRYDIALDKIKRLLGTGSNCSREDLEYVFPELKESEDEKIIQFLIHEVKETSDKIMSYRGMNKEAVLAWLEKQDKKTEPIEGFDTEFERQISHIIASAINREHEYNKGYVKWAAQSLIEYAKREIEKQGSQILANSAKTCKDEQKPADKVDQYSLPVSDNSSLPTFDESIYHPCTEEVYEQKPTEWSEEDEKTLNSILSCIKHCQDEDIEARYNGNRNVDPKRYESMSDWLKSLKDRVQPKQEWSKEDEKILDGVITNYESGYLPSVEKRDEIIEKLEYLKDRVQPQSHWRPSEEQMLAIDTAINVLGKGTLNGKQLIELQEALKKLKG